MGSVFCGIDGQEGKEAGKMTRRQALQSAVFVVLFLYILMTVTYIIRTNRPQSGVSVLCHADDVGGVRDCGISHIQQPPASGSRPVFGGGSQEDPNPKTVCI